MISVYIDTNCINARQKDPSLNQLEELYEQEKILIEKTDVLDTELQENKGYPLGQRKSMQYVESFGPGVVDHSRVGSSIVGDADDDIRLTRVLTLLWGQKRRNEYTKEEIRDAMHISTAVRYGGTYFVTTEKGLLKKAEVVGKEFGIKLRDPERGLHEVGQRLKILEAAKRDDV